MPGAVHGGRVQEAARRLNLPLEKIADFSANINPLGQPEGLREVLVSAMDSIGHYPEIGAESLTAALAKSADLPLSAVVAGSGSTPLIYQLARLLRPKKAVVVAPAFAEYGAALTLAGCPVEYCRCAEEDDFLFLPAKARALLATKPDCVILANPANPTGQLVPPETMELLLTASGIGDGFRLVIDEAFMDFCLEKRSVEPLLRERPKAIVLKSLTKIFAVPGLRLGYLASGDGALTDAFRENAEPWSINTLAQAAGLYFLTLRDFLAQTPSYTADLRQRLLAGVAPYLTAFPSAANFIMGRLQKGAKRPLIDHLFERGILIRDLDGMPGLADGYLRLAVRPPDQINRLLEALEEFYA